MTKFKKVFGIGLMVLAMGATSITVFAATQYKTPAEAIAGITGRTVEDIVQERTQTGKTYGTIANEEGKLEEYKAQILEIQKDRLADQVAQGKITQDQADAIIERIQQNQLNCDGTGLGGSKRGMGIGCGSMGQKLGKGGRMLQDGSCYTTN